MVSTDIIDVLPAGTILEMTLSVAGIISVNLKRTNLDVDFQIVDVQVNSYDEKMISEAISEINTTLKYRGVKQLEVSDIAGGLATLRI